MRNLGRIEKKIAENLMKGLDPHPTAMVLLAGLLPLLLLERGFGTGQRGR